ncbi:hypothetical protein LVISKB_0886 [Levilactobacillus brevis KB290]|uniref:Uncharacterized protein n=1 Tax=Levilactobacillus brevis KB290 TaxID=1001583 RepID=M5AZE9_LEVBR|nr:hypothetical protein LVISKB_0886 [Levilactobacillus brevis KB290]
MNDVFFCFGVERAGEIFEGETLILEQSVILNLV